MPLRRLQVDMESILDAMDAYGDAPDAYLHLATGRIELLLDPLITGEDPDFDPDEEQWVEIPRREAHEAHGLMETFAEALDEPDIQQQLFVALDGKGSFARFRHVLANHPDLRARWEAMDHDDLLQRAIEWFTELGIEPLYELRRTPKLAAVPAATPARPNITLTDLLVLGGPGGKTELLEGRVPRQYVAATAERAHKLFASLAREIAAQEGVAWRKRLLEGRNDFSLGRYHLRVEGRVVRLEVEMPPPIWDDFRRG
ncbi:MAG TPA: UPF0158 family protein [Planctomycetota bacterium]|nr:UPF0158 family protein [Planctomycetota bacterium]